MVMLDINYIFNLLNSQKAMEIENKINDSRREHFENVIKEKEKPIDDYERELTEATQSYLRAANPNPETDINKELQDALGHLNKAKEHESNSSLRQDYSNLLLALEQSITDEMAKAIK